MGLSAMLGNRCGLSSRQAASRDEAFDAVEQAYDDLLARVRGKDGKPAGARMEGAAGPRPQVVSEGFTAARPSRSGIRTPAAEPKANRDHRCQEFGRNISQGGWFGRSGENGDSNDMAGKRNTDAGGAWRPTLPWG